MSRHTSHVQHWTGSFQSGIIPKGVSSPFNPELDTKYEVEIKKTNKSKDSKKEKFIIYLKNELSDCQNKINTKKQKPLTREKIVKHIYYLKEIISSSKKLSPDEKTNFTNKCATLLSQLNEKTKTPNFRIVRKKDKKTSEENNIEIEDKTFFYDSLKKILRSSRLIIEFKDREKQIKLTNDCLSLVDKIKNSKTLSEEEKKSILRTSENYLNYIKQLKTDY